jgi:hypothetical protein
MLQGTLAQVSNRSTFELIVKLFDEDGQLMDLSGLTIVFAMCPRGSTPYWWGDTPNTASLVASTTPGHQHHRPRCDADRHPGVRDEGRSAGRL